MTSCLIFGQGNLIHWASHVLDRDDVRFSMKSYGQDVAVEAVEAVGCRRYATAVWEDRGLECLVICIPIC
jgi:hypothetical protein